MIQIRQTTGASRRTGKDTPEAVKDGYEGGMLLSPKGRLTQEEERRLKDLYVSRCLQGRRIINWGK